MAETNTIHFDLCIIGAGSGGLSVASGAAQLGLNVALIEKAEMGGDCLNTGCVPSKALLAAAKQAQGFRGSDKFGIKAQEPEVDFGKVKDHVFDVIAQIEPHDSQERFEGLGVSVFREFGTFVDSKTVKAGDTLITAKNFIISTGSKASVPPIDGLEKDKVFTNENIFDLREKPDHLAIIGGGPIGIEMAQAHRRLGSEVTVIDMASIMANDDPELVDVVRRALVDEGVKLLEETGIETIMHQDDGSVKIRVKKGADSDIIHASHLLAAAGRAPNIDIGLEAAGIEHDRRGIKVDARLRTNKKHIFAIGDVAGGPQFTHVAGYHAGIIIKNIVFKLPGKVDYTALPWVTYSDPELAHVGLLERQARETYGDSIKTVSWQIKDNDRATSERKSAGLIKVVMRKNGRIIGASIVGPSAGELIGPWILAISSGLKIGAFANMIAPYPTFGEISKRAASAYYTPSLFSDKTRKITGLLRKIPFL